MDYARFVQMLAGSGELDRVRVVVDPVAAGNLPSAGAFGWSGAASTHFIVDRKDQLVALMMYQYPPRDQRLRDEFETLVYQAIIDRP
jgi:CubicO group peptidase (beta-lactamase class C family)